MLIEQTLQQLAELNLRGMKIALQQQVEQPKTHQLSFEDRLSLIVDYEKTYRSNRKIERLIKAANLRQQAYVEDIHYMPSRGLKKEEISSLVACTWISNGFNVTLTGPTGTGKSWIACALGHQACRKGFSVSYIRVSRLLEQLRLARVEGSYSKIMAKLLKTDLLILDDWGLERLPQAHRTDMLEIIEDRHHLKSLMITSQLPLQSWHETIADPTLADAILDRLLEKSYKLELKGESMRKPQKNIVT